MLRLLKKYLIDFWIWWYIVNARETVMNLLRVWSFTFAYFNILPMLTNLFIPLYQDFTIMGRLISIPIRLTWVAVGSFLQLLVTIPLLAFLLFYLLLPLLPWWACARYFLKI